MIVTARSGLSGVELTASFTPFFGSVCAVATAILVPVGSAAPQTTGVVVSYARPVVSGRRECVWCFEALSCCLRQSYDSRGVKYRGENVPK